MDIGAFILVGNLDVLTGSGEELIPLRSQV
jgi:hypothetical protein